MKYDMVGFSFFITDFYYIFKNGIWEQNRIQNRETWHLPMKMSNLDQFNNKKHLLQCKVKYNDETIKTQDG